VAAVLARLGESMDAVGDGRVFLNRKRVRKALERVRDGDCITVGAPVAAGRGTDLAVRRLGERDDLVAFEKPAGMRTVPDLRGGRDTFVDHVARSLGRSAEAVLLTSRLDQEVSGVIVVALDPRAATRLVEARERGAYQRTYAWISSGGPAPVGVESVWDAPIGRHSRPHLRRAFGPDAKPSRTAFMCASIARSNGTSFAMGWAAPETGRTHQIRVHAAHGGAPLLGDTAYGGPRQHAAPNGKVMRFGRIALHAARVRVPDGSGGSWHVQAEIPHEFRQWWADLGGAAEAWDRAPPWEG
jgi:23S rRNA-/tRNA-specific pseudouridylate synthase